MRLDVDRHVAAPCSVVWDVLVDWERQPEWMLDARRVEVVTPQREGPGVTIHVPTSLLGVPVLDVMRVTDWDPPHRLAVTHLGRVIRGGGAFELADEAGGTRLAWWEEVEAPFGAVGDLGTRLALPVIRRIFAASLRRLAGRAEDRAQALRGGSS